MCIITDVFTHHVSYRSSFFIIPFSPTTIHHVVSHYHIRLSSHSVVVSFVSLVSSGLLVAAQLDSVLVSVFPASCVVVRSSGVLVRSRSRLAAQLDSNLLDAHSVVCCCLVVSCIVLVSVFTASCVVVRSSRVSVRLFSLLRRGSARFYSSRCSQRRVSLLGRLVYWSWIFVTFQLAPWLVSSSFDYTTPLLVSVLTALFHTTSPRFSDMPLCFFWYFV